MPWRFSEHVLSKSPEYINQREGFTVKQAVPEEILSLDDISDKNRQQISLSEESNFTVREYCLADEYIPACNLP